MPKNSITITFLGTGPAVAIPRFGHRDATCQDAKKHGSFTRRQRSSLLISSSEGGVLIDAGPDFLKQVPSLRVRLRAIFLTHEHLDATGGLRDLSSWLKSQNSRIPLFCLKETWRKIEDSFLSLKPIQVKSGQVIKVAGLTVTPFRVRHGITSKVPTLGFVVRGGTSRRRMVYASDMDGATLKSKKFFRNADLAVIDSAMWFGRKLRGHFNPEEALKFLKPLRPRRVILTQIGHSWPPYRKAVSNLAAFCKKNKIPFPVLAAHDGLKINL